MKTVLVRRNGDLVSQPIAIELHSSSSLTDLLRNACTALKMSRALIAFLPDGTTVCHPSSLPSNTELTISRGEPMFRILAGAGLPSFCGFNLFETLNDFGLRKTFRTLDPHTSASRAIKVIHKTAFLSEEYAEFFTSEMNRLAEVEHPNVLKVHTRLEKDQQIGVVTDFPGTELLSVVLKAGVFTEARARPIIWQLCLGLQHCHAKGITHGSLSLGHVFLVPGKPVLAPPSSDSHTSHVDQPPKSRSLSKSKPVIPSSLLPPLEHFDDGIARISDFGGRCMHPLPVTRKLTLTVPDHLKGEAADLWALGAMLYAMTQGETLSIERGALAWRSESSESLKDIIARMTMGEACVTDLMKDGWLADYLLVAI